MLDSFRIIAHRGASANAPENTEASFLCAEQLGALEVEMDVRFSSDLEIMVFHDDRLDRKTDCTGRFRHYDSQFLSTLDLAPWFQREHVDQAKWSGSTRIAKMADVLSILRKRVHYHIEIKDSDDLLPLRLVQMLDESELLSQVTFSSFAMRPLQAIRELLPAAQVCFLLRDAHDALRSAEFRPELEGLSMNAVRDYWVRVAAEADFQMVAVRAAEVDARIVERATQYGVMLRGWGVESEAQLLALRDFGAIGATVDWPGRALELVGSSGSPASGD